MNAGQSSVVSRQSVDAGGLGALPDGWVWKTVSESVRNIPLTGMKLPQREYLESGKIPVVDQGQNFVGGYTDQDELMVNCESPVIVFGDHTKAIKYIPFPFVAGADGVKVLKPLGFFNPKLFYYFLQVVELPDKGYARHFQYLEKENIPLPPLPEQERIVARLEELLSDLEAGVAALRRMRAGVKRYKASVLKAACDGKLLRDQGSGNKESGNGELPEGWRWVTLGELAEHVTSGSRGWAKYYSERGDLFIRVGNFNRLTTQIDLTNVAMVNTPNTPEAKRTHLKLNDVLITITADVGMVGVVDANVTQQWEDAYINQHVGLVRLTNTDFTPFIAYVLASEPLQKQFEEKQYGATKKGFNLDDLKSLHIPFPPLEEQQRIVAEVERRLESARAVEFAAEAGLKRAARLRQSVLRSAFEGRL